MTYRHGDPKAICDQCGREYHLSELRKNYRGMKVCPRDWEPRHPQELRRPIRESIGVKDPRPEPNWTTATTNPVTLLPENIEVFDGVDDAVCSLIAIANIAIAGCAQAGNSQTTSGIPTGTFNNTL